jgi:tight adherence protein B
VIASAAALGLTVALLVEFLVGSRSARSWVSGSLEPLRRTMREGHLPSVPERVRLAILAGLASIAIGWFVAGPGVAALLAAVAPFGAVATVNRSAARYRKAAARSLPDLARAVADSLSAGQSPRGSLAAAADSLEHEIGFEMARLGHQLDLGAPTGEALDGMAERLASERIDAFVGAVKSQRTTGGDLAGLLRRLADGAAERDRVADDARTATAQARFTGYLVAAMPIGAALFSEAASPGLIASVAGSVPGTILVLLSILLQAFAFLAISRIARIEVS